MSKQIIVVKPKTLSTFDKAKLTKEGNIVIEHPNPGEIIYRQQEEHLPYIHLNCAACGERIYMLKEREDKLRQNGYTFYCTQGHENVFTKK